MRLFLIPFLFAMLGNADIVKLVKAGLSAETIEAKIGSSTTDFDTSTDALVALAGEGVPDRVIRAMIDREHVVPPAPPVPSAPPAPAAQPRVTVRRYDVKVHAEGGGKCDGELRLDAKGVQATRCKALDFDLAWSALDSACFTYGMRNELVLKTKSGSHRVSTTTPAEARRLVEYVRAAAPTLPVGECH